MNTITKEHMSLRGYAKHRKTQGMDGGSHVAVQKAIRTGRITTTADGNIDPA